MFGHPLVQPPSLILRAVLSMGVIIRCVPALLAIMVITRSIVHFRHHVDTLLLVLVRSLLCWNTLLSRLHTNQLLGCVRAHLCGRVPVLQTVLHILRVILGLHHRMGAVLPLVTRSQAGVCLAFPGAHVFILHFFQG